MRLNPFLRGLRLTLQRLREDENGAVLTAEAAMVSTLAVVGVGVGLSALADAVNEELKDVASAIRSLDQSYAFEGSSGCGAATAGSMFIQPDVEVSLQELHCDAEDLSDEEVQKRRDAAIERLRRDHGKKHEHGHHGDGHKHGHDERDHDKDRKRDMERKPDRKTSAAEQPEERPVLRLDPTTI